MINPALTDRDPQHIRRMFAGVAPRYNLLNHLLSGCLDRMWRRQFCRALSLQTQTGAAVPRAIDICAGTGHLARECLRRHRGIGLMVVSDFVPEMLARCPDALREDPRAVLVAADALHLPFADGHFDLAMNAFGLRNTADPSGAIAEMLRVVRPGGLIGLLEFFRPRPAFWRSPAGLWVRYMVPVLGGIISPNPEAYRYLPQSMDEFMSPGECHDLLQTANCEVLHARQLLGGVTSAVIARKLA